MNDKELVSAFNDSFNEHKEKVLSLLKTFEPLAQAVNQISDDLVAGTMKESKHTIYSSISDDNKIGISIYLKSGTYRFSLLKSELKQTQSSSYMLSNLSERIVNKIFTLRIYGKPEKYNHQYTYIDTELRKVGMNFSLSEWLWLQLNKDDATKIVTDELKDVSKRDLTDEKKRETHIRKIALKRLKEWSESAANTSLSQANLYASGLGREVLKARLPSKDNFLKLINKIISTDVLYDEVMAVNRVINDRRYGNPIKQSQSKYMGMTDYNELVFVQGLIRAAYYHSGQYIDKEFQPNMDDVNNIYKYLIAKSIIDM